MRQRTSPDNLNPSAADDPRIYVRLARPCDDPSLNFQAIRSKTLWQEREAREAEAAKKRLEAK